MRAFDLFDAEQRAAGTWGAWRRNAVFGKLVIFRRDGSKLTHVTDGQIGHACQGVVWSEDGKRLLVQCSVERDIRTLDFDGKTLTERPEAVINMESRPGVMVTSKAR